MSCVRNARKNLGHRLRFKDRACGKYPDFENFDTRNSAFFSNMF